MKAVGIKQLKSKLSEYVRMAKAGETILVTDREEVVAELCPARTQKPVAANLEGVLDSLAEIGAVRRASLPLASWKPAAKGFDLETEVVADLLAEIRDDR